MHHNQANAGFQQSLPQQMALAAAPIPLRSPGVGEFCSIPCVVLFRVAWRATLIPIPVGRQVPVPPHAVISLPLAREARAFDLRKGFASRALSPTRRCWHAHWQHVWHDAGFTRTEAVWAPPVAYWTSKVRLYDGKYKRGSSANSSHSYQSVFSSLQSCLDNLAIPKLRQNLRS